jgi:hypothetical protein
MMLAAGGWGFVLLSENTDWLPWLRWPLFAFTLLGALGFVVGSMLDLRKLTAVAVLLGMLGGLGGSVAYSIATASVAHSGSIPSAGASGTAGIGGGQGGGMGGGTPPSGSRAGGSSSSTSTASLAKLLTASNARWAAAVDGSQSAATLELSTGVAVMAIGGWSSDPAPTLAEFEAWVKAGDIGYYVSGTGMGAGGPGNGTSTASAIATWVAAHYAATTVGGSTVYDLSNATG